MIVRYRHEISENEYKEYEFEGTLAEAAEFVNAAKEGKALWNLITGDGNLVL